MTKLNINTNQIAFTILAVITILVIGGTSYTYYDLKKPVNYHTGADSYNEAKHFAINPKTILGEVKQGSTNVFLPFVEPDDGYYDQPSGSYSWRQSDFIKIAQLLDKYAWGDSQGHWQISDIYFRGNCAILPLGFDTFNVRYFYMTDLKEYKHRLAGLFLTIDRVEAGQDAVSKVPLWGLEGFYLDDVNVSADEAFNIADQNGGLEARTFVGNQCSVTVEMNSLKDGWRIKYYEDGNEKAIFTLKIDAITGVISNPDQ